MKRILVTGGGGFIGSHGFAARKSILGRGRQSDGALRRQHSGRRLDRGHDQATEPVPLFRLLSGGDPARRDDVVRYPLSLRNVEDRQETGH